MRSSGRRSPNRRRRPRRMAELIASLPRQIYCYVDRTFLSQGQERGFEPCAWFGLVSVPSRAWGLTVLLESGAVYTPLPPHAIAFSERPRAHDWRIDQAQRWDCFGVQFAVHEYEQLRERDVEAYVAGEWIRARYLFTAQHYDDGYSREPSQTKQYHFLQTEGDRLTALPGNCCLFHDTAFTRVSGKPSHLRVQRQVFYAEHGTIWDDTIGEETA